MQISFSFFLTLLVSISGSVMHGHTRLIMGSSPRQVENCTICQITPWPDQDTLKHLGQPSGIDVDQDGKVYVFHRGDRIWDGDSFNGDVWSGPSHPVPNKTILVLDPQTGAIERSFGKDMFYLPHMLTVDKQGNIWVTDVALHQVFKLSPTGSVLLTLGTKLQPGNDDDHFCKPTDVAVTSDGNYFFVSDGYCNGRIIKYQLIRRANGTEEAVKLFQWGHKSIVASDNFAFDVPHSLALDEELGLVCVADREHGRILCYNMDTGSFVKKIKPNANVGTSVYGIAISRVKGFHRIFAVSGEVSLLGIMPEGFEFDLVSGNLVSTFNARQDGFMYPHDVAVTKDGEFIYEIELYPFNIYKFEDTRYSQTRRKQKAQEQIDKHIAMMH